MTLSTGRSKSAWFARALHVTGSDAREREREHAIVSTLLLRRKASIWIMNEYEAAHSTLLHQSCHPGRKADLMKEVEAELLGSRFTDTKRRTTRIYARAGGAPQNQQHPMEDKPLREMVEQTLESAVKKHRDKWSEA